MEHGQLRPFRTVARTLSFTRGGAWLRTVKDRLGVEGFEVRYGGLIAVNERIGQDLRRAEIVSVPILLILLVNVFRSLTATSLPLIVGVVVAVGSLSVLRVVGTFEDISTFSTNLVMILGLAIDYALIVVNRFREELAAWRPVDLAVERTMATAGRTIAFTGVAVAVTAMVLVIFPSRFLVSMASATVSVVLFAVLSGLLLRCRRCCGSPGTGSTRCGCR